MAGVERIVPLLSLTLIGVGFGFIYWPLAPLSVGLLIWVDLSLGSHRNNERN